MAKWAGRPEFPGMHKILVPPTPAGPDCKEMLVAHRIDDATRAMGHAEERMSAGLRAPTAELRGYHAVHIANHCADALNNMHFLVDDIRRHYPAEAAELEALKQCVALAKALSRATRIATTAHLVETVLHELTHAKRHADEMLKPDPRVVWDFNADHCRKHLKGAQEHLDKLSEHVVDNYPAEGRWIRIIKQLQDGRLATDEAAFKALKLAGGSLKGDHAGRAPQRGGSVPPGAFNVQVPGRKDQFGLMQKPGQAVSPSPPLPSSVPLPTARECTALISKVPTGIDVTLSTTVKNALRMAALKFQKNDVIEALACLRQAQSALYSASKKDAGAGRPAVYGAAAVPPYEAGSALAQMFQAYQGQAQAWREIGHEVAVLIDRTRRHWFAGRVNGYMPNLRM